MKKINYNWTPRVSRRKIERLYESDAAGLLDEELLEDVCFSFYMRCKEGQEVMDSVHKMRVKCRNCDSIIVRRRKHDHDETLRCSCGWETTWGHYRRSTFSQNMCNGNADPFFFEYMSRWKKAKTPADKLRSIDWLIHQFHVQDNIPGRAVGPNVILGNKYQVAELIINLAYGKDSIASMEAKENYIKMQNNWRKKLVEKLGGNTKTRHLANKMGIKSDYSIPLDSITDKIAEFDESILKELLN